MSPPSVWRGEIALSTRVNESKLVSLMSGSPGSDLTGSLTYRNWMSSAMNNRFFLMGPRTEKRGSKPRMRVSPFSRGVRPPGLISHSLVPRRVRNCVTLVEKRPYSAEKGFASSSTDSRLWPGSSRSKSPDDGSMRLVLLIWSAPCVGWPPFARSRPSGPRMTPGRSGNRLWKSSPWSGAMSRTEPDSMSLVETGCTL